ncbi:MAG: tricarballylate utilization 4Fe-4S protein TcuB [Acidobacteria bacterium]|nr:tricarballylate utilization 4Fe-4S protein TcuB [Acidobacteriota bacterium]
MTVCNACRYCEGYCAVFPAMEMRASFQAADLHYLANLCHNCGECLYACQYAAPHEFAINVPRTLAELRLVSYEAHAWPGLLARAFRRQSVATSVALAAAMIAVMLLAAMAAGNASSASPDPASIRAADFYHVLPHDVMVALFGGVFTFVLVALGVGLARFQRETTRAPGLLPQASGGRETRPTYTETWTAMRAALTLKYLRGHGADCTDGGQESRSPLRRWFHHCTFFGFLLCAASTSVAAVYHGLGWTAPYGYLSLPVLLGAAGGWGLVVGPAGLYWIGGRRDAAAGDPAQRPLDRGFIVLLLSTSVTGLLLLAGRETAAMPALLVIHLGIVLALFITLPYGKFVHGLYRAAALMQYSHERS